ncbi:MAG: ABC transporter substrate-binding protein [Candidatus Acidiferrum sp.]
MPSKKRPFRKLFCTGSFCALFLLVTLPAPAQSPETDAAKSASQAPSANQRYANMPEDAVPYRKFSKPYKEWFLTDDTLGYNGAARERLSKEIGDSETVNIGFLGPIQNNPESPYGIAMLHGAQLAIEQANAKGGYRAPGSTHSKNYVLKVHYDSAQWGASSTEAVKMVFDEQIVGVLGSVDGASTHIMLRVALKLEFPIMDTATTDPTVTETRIPWLIHNFPDDRQQGYALAEAVFKECKLKRIGVIRTQSRYARVGVQKFIDEAKRLGHVPVLEVKFERGDQDFATQLRMLQNAHVDGVVIWGEVPEAAKILTQMRAMEMKQPVFGPSRLCYAQIIDLAGPDAEGLVTATAMDPTRVDASWLEFKKGYRAKFNEEPDAYAARAYDGMNILIHSVEKAGLNRGKIMDVLRDYQGHEYEGVAGNAQFDHTLNNIAPITMAKVEAGKFVYSPPKVQTAASAKETAGER